MLNGLVLPIVCMSCSPEMYDVCIASEDGIRLQCHKCVLVARLEYFRSMLGSGWIETSNSTALTLPVPADILTVILNFFYTDEASAFSGTCLVLYLYVTLELLQLQFHYLQNVNKLHLGPKSQLKLCSVHTLYENT